MATEINESDINSLTESLNALLDYYQKKDKDEQQQLKKQEEEQQKQEQEQQKQDEISQKKEKDLTKENKVTTKSITKNLDTTATSLQTLSESVDSTSDYQQQVLVKLDDLAKEQKNTQQDIHTYSIFLAFSFLIVMAIKHFTEEGFKW